MGFKYCTSEFSWDKFYLIEHFDLAYRIMFAKRFKAKNVAVNYETSLCYNKQHRNKLWRNF
jgi:hypothetical protein